MEPAGHDAQSRVAKKATRESKPGAGEDERRAEGSDPPATSTGQGEDSSLQKRRALEEDYVDVMLSGSARTAGRPALREFFRARARSLPDEVLAAHCNLSGGKDYGESSTMLRDLDLVMKDAMDTVKKGPE